jgi:selT/selW/selH-like putative selenoprotein
LAAELKQAFPDTDVRLIPSSGGAFEVTVDGTLVFSKKASRRHAEPGEVVRLVQDSAEQAGG